MAHLYVTYAQKLVENHNYKKAAKKLLRAEHWNWLSTQAYARELDVPEFVLGVEADIKRKNMAAIRQAIREVVPITGDGISVHQSFGLYVKRYPLFL